MEQEINNSALGSYRIPERNIDFSDLAEQSFEQVRYNRASNAQIRAAKRFSSESRDSSLTVSQAVKRLEECFYVLEKGKEVGLSFADAWDQYAAKGGK